MNNTLDELAINTIRTLAMDAVQKANSGHPGTPMALAPLGFTLWDKFIRLNPANPDWPNRDRFVLSAGHASMLLYGLLHITGFDMTLEDIKNFRQLHSRTPGHPENYLTPGVETTTGPLGQGCGNSVGMAIAGKWLEHHFNRPGFDIIDYKVFVIASDGDMMEGVASEAASLAGHLGLCNLIWFYDNNSITIEGETKLAFSDNVCQRFEAYHWFVQHVDDINDTAKLEMAIKRALMEKDKPSMIVVDSHIAFGSPGKQDTAEAHGAPLGEDEVRKAKINYGWDPDKHFYVPEEICRYREECIKRGKEREETWNQLFNSYSLEYPELAKEFEMLRRRELPEGWDCCIPDFPADPKGMAGRKGNEKILNAIAPFVPWLIGGSGDLALSTLTLLKDQTSFAKGDYHGRNLHFGVREHAMAATCNGMALSKLRPYCATFLIFSDYMRPALRLSAIMQLPVIFIFTHDSVGLGEDGPTHQPIEHLASLRAMPNMQVVRPADPNELAVLWKHFIMPMKDKPIAIALSRQTIPVIDRTKYKSAEGAARGAYILADGGGEPELILMSTGSEVNLVLQAYEELKSEGIKARVVSMPCWELFEQQDSEYRESVLPPHVTARIAVEAASEFGWWRYIGQPGEGEFIGMRTFGASAPFAEIYKDYGLTRDRIAETARDILSKNREKTLSAR